MAAPTAAPSTRPTATLPSAAPNTMPRATPMPTQDAARFVDVLVLGLDSSGWDAISAVGSVILLVGGAPPFGASRCWNFWILARSSVRNSATEPSSGGLALGIT